MKEFCIHTKNKLSAEITHEFDKDTLSRLIQSGIFTFGIDLFYGSVEQNLAVVTRLREAVAAESEESGFSVPLSVYLRISPRTPFTGSLGDCKKNFHLESNSQVVLTANREYASRCCPNTIYMNARYLLLKVEKCDVIRVGKVIQLQVTQTDGDKVTCTVKEPGEMVNRMSVEFPRKLKETLLMISAEELEDLTLAMETGITIIATESPEIPEVCSQVRGALDELKFGGVHLFTRLTLEDLEEEYSNVGRLIDDFDGFVLDCGENVKPDKIVNLPAAVHKFVKEAHAQRKPLFLRGCWSSFVEPSDYEIAFFYPDKYILPCKSDFLHLYEAFSHKFALHEKPTTGISTLARSVASASYELGADAIIVCDESGRMSEMIAHHRSTTPIIAVTSVPDAVNFSGMYHNVWMLLLNKSVESSHKEDIRKKLVHGVQYALKKRVVCAESRVILVYRKIPGNSSPDNFLIIKFADNYLEVIRNAILDEN